MSVCGWSGGVIVTSLVEEAGCSADKPALVGGLGGFLSNYRSLTADVGLSPAVSTPACPWRIVVGRGQRINLTLVDFATPKAASNVALRCVQYAVVTELHTRPSTSLAVCGGARRRRHLHTTLSNAVDVRVTSGRHGVDSDEHFYFLLHYKGQQFAALMNGAAVPYCFSLCSNSFLRFISEPTVCIHLNDKIVKCLSALVSN